MSSWYGLDSSEVLQKLETTVANGLSPLEVTHRLKQYGLNKLTEQPGENLWQILPPVNFPLMFMSQERKTKSAAIDR